MTSYRWERWMKEWIKEWMNEWMIKYFNRKVLTFVEWDKYSYFLSSAQLTLRCPVQCVGVGGRGMEAINICNRNNQLLYSTMLTQVFYRSWIYLWSCLLEKLARVRQCTEQRRTGRRYCQDISADIPQISADESDLYSFISGSIVHS